MWQQILLKLRAEHSAELEELLLEAGASSVTLMDAEDQLRTVIGDVGRSGSEGAGFGF